MFPALAALLALLSQQPPVKANPAPPVSSQPTQLDRLTREVASGLRCPVCQGLSIQDSPAELAVEMKGVVREQLAAGKTPEQVRAYFIEKYGEWVLLAPEPSGFNILVYVLPVAVVLGGGWFVWGFVRRHTAEPQSG
ncbi:MAG: cytochrome c-type biogenesis protein [Gemmatimonadaceae bacterium]